MISIVIPTLNEEKVLAQTLSTLRAGLTLPHEIIVSDGGSTDETVIIARRLGVTVVEHDQIGRQTIAAGRNAAAKIARGNFLVFIDADCEIPQPDKFFSAALKHFEDRHLVSLTVYLRVFPEIERLGDKFVGWLRNFAVRISNNFLRKGDCAGGEFQMVRADAFRQIGGYREELVTCEDRDLFRRLSKIGRTLSDRNLIVFHTARRAHILGWPYLIWLFLLNTISFRLRGRAYSKEWEPVR